MVYIAGDKVYRIKIALDQKITFEELELIQLAYEEVLKKHSYLSKYSISNSIDKSND